MFRRLRMVVRGLLAPRSRPDLDALRAETDAERFVWAVLPHAARSFAASIVVLPRSEARVAAVAYLYARMLDTYEDLLPDEKARPAALRAFARRFATDPLVPAAQVPADLANDDRDRLHILLVEKAGRVDEVFAALSTEQRLAIGLLVADMAEGMAWSSERFADQGGVLVDDQQLLRYCHNVIGYPARFVIELLTGRPPVSTDDAFAASEMIQLANITRDIEKDLARGVGYDPSLKPHLGGSAPAVVRAVRERLVGVAVARAPAYRRLYDSIELRRRPGARLAAVLMFLFTDLHYRSMVGRVGRTPWPGPGGKASTVVAALPAFASSRYASWVIARVERRLVDAGRSIS